MNQPIPALLSINATCQSLGVGRTNLYAMINKGMLKTVKLGRRTLVKVSSIEALIGENEVAH